jgi:hydroxymethylpyrimidine pyrophosphatase-like HAD family hydrolase
VVGENGAFTFFMEKGVRRRINTPAGAEEVELKQKLEQLSARIKKQFPHAKWASDQSYREYDLAVDICEDVETWPSDDVNALLNLCKAEGAHAKLSSIHVNTWFGDYDKKKGFQYWLSQGAPGFRGETIPSKDQWIYIGDSPNDEPMFSSFPYSVGVANLTKYLSKLQALPTWLTESESGKGFSEMTQRLVQIRSGK